ncbi:MAG: hypothetical protein AAF108_02600 [Planctomycetota bacterium]
MNKPTPGRHAGVKPERPIPEPTNVRFTHREELVALIDVLDAINTRMQRLAIDIAFPRDELTRTLDQTTDQPPKPAA